MDVLAVQRSNGALLSAGGGNLFGSNRPADTVHVRSSVPVSVRFYDDNGNRTLLNPASGALTFTAQPALNDTFTVGTQVYTIVASVAAAGDVKLGATVADTVANLAAAITGATVILQGAGTTYGLGTNANPGATAAVSGSTLVFTPTGGSIAVSTTSTATFASNTLTFTALPAVGNLFTVGTVTYKVVSALTGAANEVLTATTLAAFLPNLAAAIDATTAYGQGPGTTYGTGTVPNGLVSVVSGGSTIVLTALLADASGNAIVTTTTSAHAAFGAATLTGGEVLNLDIKPTGEYDADFTLPSPVFTAPADPATGDYTGTLNTNVVGAIALLEPNNPGKGLLTFTAQPTANDTFTVGLVTYKAVAALTGAADEVLRGANLAAFIANLIGAVNGATTGGQAAGTTYGTGTVANTLATAVPGTAASTILFTATAAGSSVPVATGETSSAASFGAAFLTAGTSTNPEPDSVPLMAQLSWGAPGTPLQRSDECTLNLTNCIRHDDEEEPEDAEEHYTTEEVLATMAQAAAATAALAGLSTPGIAYLRTGGDDDRAAIGDPSRPFLTAQALGNAVFAQTTAGHGPFEINVGVGTWTGYDGSPGVGGNGSNWPSSVTFRGQGPTLSHFGGIRCDGGPGADAVYDGDGNLVTAAAAGGNGGAVEIYASDIDLGLIASDGGLGGHDVGSNGTDGQGGNGGAVVLHLDNAVAAVSMSANTSGTANGYCGTVTCTGGELSSIDFGGGFYSYGEGPCTMILDSCTVTGSIILSGQNVGASGYLAGTATHSRWVGHDLIAEGAGNITDDGCNSTA